MRYSLTCGVFDCLHEGHINLFELMRKESDAIIVILHDDRSTFKNKGRFPVQNMQQRWFNLSICGYIDKIIGTYKPDPSATIAATALLYKPVIYMRGDDWTHFPGRQAIESAKIPIKLVPYTEGISSTMRRAGVNR